MRDSTKVIIGFGSIWGLFAFGLMLVGSFTIGMNDTTPEIVAIVLYGLTILPSCILVIWYRKAAAIWLITLAAISAFGFIYQIFEQPGRDRGYGSLLQDVAGSLFLAAIPSLLGVLLFRSHRGEELGS
jgi:hypothetical protein